MQFYGKIGKIMPQVLDIFDKVCYNGSRGVYLVSINSLSKFVKYPEEAFRWKKRPSSRVRRK